MIVGSVLVTLQMKRWVLGTMRRRARVMHFIVQAGLLLSPSVMIKLLRSAIYNGNIVLKNVRCYVFLLLTGNQ
jgi:hypothetical protein